MSKSLDQIKRGRLKKPLRVLLYGPEGVGKTSFGADAPGALLLGTEAGTEHLDLQRIPEEDLRSWQSVMQWLQWVAEGKHDFKSLVVDTLDWLEPICHRFVAQRARKEDIEDFDYAGGYKLAMGEWRSFVERLELVRRRGLHVVLLAHAKVTKFDDPNGESWDRYSPKLYDSPKASAVDLFVEWADVVLFATYDYRARKKNKWDTKGVGGRQRVMYTETTAAFRAKNRYNLPHQLELSWGAFFSRAWGATDLQGEELERELERFRELVGNLPSEEQEKPLAWAGKISGKCDRGMLAKAVNRIRVRLDELAHEGPAPQDAGDVEPEAQADPYAEDTGAAPGGDSSPPGSDAHSGPQPESGESGGVTEGGASAPPSEGASFPMEEPSTRDVPAPATRGGK